MTNVVGVFEKRSAALEALRRLRLLGFGKEKAAMACFQQGIAQAFAGIPDDASEQPGMARTFGALLGGALGLATGLSLASAMAWAISSAYNLDLAIGIALGLAVAAAGALAGAAGGRRVDRVAQSGLPLDERCIYTDAVRQGRDVVVCMASNSAEEEEGRDVLQRSGAETVDWARHQPWLGIEDVRRHHYVGPPPGENAPPDHFRRGFEASLDAEFRGKPWDQVLYRLAEEYRDWFEPRFRAGFERGQKFRHDEESAHREVPALTGS